MGTYMRAQSISLREPANRWTAALILGLAVAAGGWLRLSNLGAYEITADESVSWVAASAPTVTDVFRVTSQVTYGKLGVYEFVLRFWILAFGDSLVSMRALSGVLGTIAIPLVFAVTVELFAGGADWPGLPREEAEVAAAIGALIFAVNLVAIRLSRETRMYPFLMLAVLGHIWFLLRAVRQGGALNYAAATFLILTAMAANYFAALILWTEGAWLLWRAWSRGWRPRSVWTWSALGLAVALSTACFSYPRLVPKRLQTERFREWYRVFGGGSGYVLRDFLGQATRGLIAPVTIGLAGWGSLQSWRRTPEALWFTVLWMLGPVVLLAWFFKQSILLLAVPAYAWIPVFIQRYFFVSFAPFCILIGFGIWELRPNSRRVAALALVIVLALGKIRAYEPTIDDLEWGVQWREAAEIVEPDLRKGRVVNVLFFPSAVQYYLRDDRAVNPALLQHSATNADTLILTDLAVTISDAKAVAKLRGTYPHVVAHLHGVWVLRR